MLLRFKTTAVLLGALLLSACQSLPEHRQAQNYESAKDEAPRYVVRASDASRWTSAMSAAEQDETSVREREIDLWELTRQKMALEYNPDQESVQARLNWYKEHDRYLDRVAVRASRYYYYILHEVIDRGIPAEIALLPAIESSYDPFVKSPARAAGPWQFIPSTGDHFGLKRNWWYDGRQDIIESTQAALTYLTYLHDFFDDDWLLALAAYNAGEGTVQRAIRKNKKAGKPTDFWNLDLPRETRAYVPKLLALAEIFKAPQEHGLQLNPLPNTPYFEVVELDSQIELNRLAELSGVDPEELRYLNPGFKRWATDPEGPHRLLVPVDQADSFETALASLGPNERISFARYEVRSGDTLSTIARRYNISTDAIRQANQIRGSLIRSGQSLMIPAPLVDSDAYVLSSNEATERRLNQPAPESSDRVVYTLNTGDTLWSIAQRHQISTRQLAAWNNIELDDTLQPGQQLVLFVPESEPEGLQQYRVQRGDTLGEIALRYDVSVEQLLEWNSLSTDSLLRPGQQLKIGDGA